MGKIIGNRFELIDLIGEGGMGEVYRGRDNQTRKDVAIKVLKGEILESDPELVKRFEREADALRQLNHPNIIRVITSFSEDNQHYIVMDYIAGGDLQTLIKREGLLPVERAVEISLDLADALTRAHRLKIVHRDIKPANVLIADDGTPRLTDFGIARIGEKTRMTQTGMIVGTYSYLSPEAIEGQPMDERSDIWAFGVMIFQMLTGQRPFNGDSAASIMYAVLSAPPTNIRELRTDVPPALAELLDKMLAKKPSERISSVRQVGAELEKILQSLEVGMEDPVGERESRFVMTPSASQIPSYEILKTSSTPIFTPTPVSSTIMAKENRAYVSLVGVILLLLLVIAVGFGWYVGHEGGDGESLEDENPSEANNATLPLPSNNQGQNAQGNPRPPVEAVLPVAPDELMILIADLEPINTQPRNVMRFVQEDLEDNLESGIPFSRYRIRRYHYAITTPEEARQVAEQNGATVIVWGSITPDFIEFQIQVGVLGAFRYNDFSQRMLSDTADVRVRITDEHTQSIAPQVLSVLMTLNQANGDVYETLQTFAQLDALNVTGGEIVGDTVASNFHRYSVEYNTDKAASLEAINKAIELSGGNPLVYTARATLKLSMDDIAGAEEDARTAARLANNTNWVIPDTLLASVAVTKNDLDTALELYNEIVTKHPDDWYSYNFRGSIYYLRHEYDLAKADYEKALSMEPTAEFPYIVSTMLALRDGQISEAQGYMDTLLREFPDTSTAVRSTRMLGMSDTLVFGYLFSAFGNLNLARYQDVLRDTEAARAIRDDLADIYYLQGTAYCNLEDYENAEASYTKAIELEPDFALLYLGRASVRLMLSDMPRAIEDVETARALPLSPELQRLSESGLAGEVSCKNILDYKIPPPN